MESRMRIVKKMFLGVLVSAVALVLPSAFAAYGVGEADHDLVRRLWWTSGSALAVLLCVWGFLLRGICGSLRSGTAFAAELSAGNLDARWETMTRDEIGHMAEVVNSAWETIVEERRMYEAILHSLPFPVATIDLERRFMFVNNAGEKAFGIPLKELQGRPCSCWNASVCNTPQCALESYLRGIRDVVFEQPGLGVLKARVVPLHNRSGEHVGFIDMVFDITEEHKNRERISSLHDAITESSRDAHDVTVRQDALITTVRDQLDATAALAMEQEQASSRTAGEMQEVNLTMQEMGKRVRTAVRNAQTTQGEAARGTEMVERTVEEMRSLATRTKELTEGMRGLEEHASDITQVITLIEDIADQTNLLALNAAIEAARAGESGRGFAVVADEVRKLAEKTMTATQEVARTVTALQSGVERNMRATEQVEALSRASSELAEQTGSVLDSILDMSRGTAADIGAVGAVAEEQSALSRAVAERMEALSGQAQHTAGNMRQTSQEVARVAGLSRVLKDIIEAMQEERRIAPRLVPKRPVEGVLRMKTGECRTLLRNISKTGACFESAKPLEGYKNAEVRISLALPGWKEGIRGTVVWVDGLLYGVCWEHPLTQSSGELERNLAA